MSQNRMCVPSSAVARNVRGELQSVRRVCAYEQGRLAKLIEHLNAAAKTPSDREMLAVCVETLGTLLQAQIALVDAAIAEARPCETLRAA